MYTFFINIPTKFLIPIGDGVKSILEAISRRIDAETRVKYPRKKNPVILDIPCKPKIEKQDKLLK